MPTSGNAAASTALPQPPNTSQNVPRSSAAALFVRVILSTPVNRGACARMTGVNLRI
jgi:hypothetical protein